MPPTFNALIRTHHITSRKKVAKLRAAASNHNVYALLCYGGCPGIMYCQGTESGVRDWVSTVQRLRYKDFQLVKKPSEKLQEGPEGPVTYGKAEEVESVKDFGAKIQELGIWTWWRKGMGYVSED
ncbi:hypothetical protein DPSP01_003459 [Paraphaeosphaeria sporulosa]|uniref:Uncharacterized protein n=1 Tax=Paraphaeosphaeria sporulosa TaxID=1460663 RepID=A0A177CE77_9PLEO|nr:uncharacterized protein CC84DRAFT_826545 [Paraphaeosphaeria sporulosa]OAG05067.1 hypothetical protein CC84DRAFT_826545 [Paraphaeosphaeria sporulosa]